MNFIWYGDVIKILLSIVESLIRILPFLMIGVGFGALLETFNWNSKFARLFSGKNAIAFPIASIAGTFSPLCSCGVIPGIAALLIAGVPVAPVMAFWVSSPLMNPEAFLITYGTLGGTFAFARVISTLVIALGAGYSTAYFVKKGFLNNQIKVQSFSKNKENCCLGDQNKVKEFTKRWFKLCLHIGKFLIIAFAIEAVMIEYVSMDWIANLFGRESAFGPLMAGVLGVPLYTSGIAAVPLIRGMMDLGMDHGSALAFMIGGAATSIPAMIAVISLVKKRTFFLYLLFSMGGAIIFGYVFRIII